MNPLEVIRINRPAALPQSEVDTMCSFLFKHLGEFRDPEWQIQKCFEYLRDPQRGGALYKATLEDRLAGLVVINHTHMAGYLPQNFLVYIAVDENYQGKGIGSQLLSAVIEDTEGEICLHVEPHNPAKKLYEKFGFTNKYLEMRYQKHGNS